MDDVKQAIFQVIVVLFLTVVVIYYFTSLFAAVTFAIFLCAVYIAWCFWQRRFVVPFNLVKPQGNFVPLEEVFWNPRGQRGLLVKRCDQSSTNEVENRIIARLRQDSPVNISERSWDRNLDDGQQPVIVFCVISSRIGTDIENAIRGVHGNSPLVLVLLHCVLSSMLRGDLRDDEELLDTTLRIRMTGIAHFAFSDREGLYDCRQNTIGFERLLGLVGSLSGE